MRTVYEVIKRPVISEKSTALSEVAGKYVFEVATQANKTEIRDAVQRLFNVEVRSVRTSVMHGKLKRVGRRDGKNIPQNDGLDVDRCRGQRHHEKTEAEERCED